MYESWSLLSEKLAVHCLPNFDLADEAGGLKQRKGLRLTSTSRAEKSAEAFRQRKLVIFPFLSFLIQTVYISPIVE